MTVMKYICCIIFFIQLQYAYAQNPSQENNAPVKIEFTNGQLSVKANDAPLSIILSKLSEIYPVIFKFTDNSLNKKMTCSIDNKLPEIAIKNLLKNYSHISYFKNNPQTESDILYKVEILTVSVNEKTNDNHSNIAASASSTFDATDNLQGFTDPLTISLLKSTLKSSEHPQARIRAVELLSKINSRDAQLAVESALGDKNPTVRQQTIELLTKRDSKETVLLLGQVILNDPDKSLRSSALNKLAKLNIKPAIAFITAARKDRDPSVRQIANQILSKIK